MMTRLAIIGLVVVAGLLGQQLRSGRMAPGAPNEVTYSGLSLTSFRLETRIHGFTINTTRQRIASFDYGVSGGILISLWETGSQIVVTDFINGGASFSLSLVGLSNDILVRCQRDVARGKFYCEAWDANGRNYRRSGIAAATVPGATSSLVGFGPANFAMAWWRLFPAVLDEDAAPPSNANTGAPAVNVLFENTVADTTGKTVAVSGAAPAYEATPVVPLLGEDRTVRAGQPFSLNCGDTDTAAYRWQQLDGPAPVTFSNREAAAAVVRGANLTGTYSFQCEGRDSAGQWGFSTIRVGAVASNAGGVVLAPSAITFLTAPMLRAGASPWPFYDRNRPRLSLETGREIVAQMEADLNTPLPGLVTVAQGSSQVTGQGTAFLSQYAPGTAILFYYVPAGGGTARAVRTVAAVANDGLLTLTAAWDRPGQTMIEHQRFGDGDASDAYARWSESLNYYDNVATLYITYFKTGLTEFASLADRVAQLWWWYLDGRVDWAPRNIMFEGLMIAAERGVLDREAVYQHAQRFSFDDPAGLGYRNYITERNTTNDYQNFYFGARESGYSWRYGVALAQLHPSATVRNDWNSRLAANIQNHYRDFQCRASNPALPSRCREPEGAFRWEDAAWNGLAEQPWHTGIVMQGLIRYHRWTNNTVARQVIADWVTHLMTNKQPNGPGEGSLWLRIPSSFPGVDCRRHYYWHLEGPTMASNAGGGCAGGFDAVYGGRDINNEIVSSYGYAFQLTGQPGARMRGDDVFGATWGGDDGFFSQWAWRQASNRAKVLGQGLCCNDSYLVDRLPLAARDTDAQPLSLRVPFRLANVNNAADVLVTLTKPDGTQVQQTCTTSPCVVTADRVQGDHLLEMEYRSTGGVRLATTGRRPVVVAP